MNVYKKLEIAIRALEEIAIGRWDETGLITTIAREALEDIKNETHFSDKPSKHEPGEFERMFRG